MEQCHQSVVEFYCLTKTTLFPPVWCEMSVWCTKLETGGDCSRLCFNLCLGHITTQTLLRGFARRIFIFGQVEPHQWQLVSWMILVFSPSLLSITIRSCQVASVTLLLLLVVASRNLHLQFKTFYIHNRSYKTFYIHSRSYKTFYVRSRS